MSTLIIFLRSTKKAAPALSIAVCLCLAFAAGAWGAPRKALTQAMVKVTFRVEGGNGTIKAAVDGKPIVSGDSVMVDDAVAVPMSAVFTAVPYNGYRVAQWLVKGLLVDIRSTELRTNLQAGESMLDVVVRFERIPIYTVTFDANGGSVSPASGTTGVDGTLDSLPMPARPGYAFKGWFTAPTGGVEVTTSSVINLNTTIYAQWTSTQAVVTFGAAANGTLTAAVGLCSRLFPTMGTAFIVGGETSTTGRR